MALPVYNWSTSADVTGDYCTIVAFSPNDAGQVSGPNSGYVLDIIHYYIVGDSSAAGSVTFQELGPDGTWRAMAKPAPITLSTTTVFQDIINGPVHGIRMAVTLSGGTLPFVELIGAVRAM